MLKQKFKIRNYLSKHAGVAVLALVLVFGLVGGIVHADQYDQQIQQLRQQNAAKQQSLDSLQVEASSYQDAINKLQARIDQLQRQIVDTQAKQAEVRKKIADAETELNHQKTILSEAIKTIYFESETSTLEVLLSSNNLSDFVDQEQYHITVQNNVKALVDKINALKQQLKTQNDRLTLLLKDQKNQQGTLASARNEQTSLLSYNESRQSSFNQQIQENNSTIASLRAQQAAANRALGGQVVAGDPNHGGYPNYLASAPKDALVDPWGMYNRECVSYTAWKVQQRYGYMPYWGGRGNANQWPASARADGIPTGSTPRVGSVAISMSGYYGHSMWVEAVSGNMIYVSQYNFGLNGEYSEMWVNGSNFTYIYFN